MKVPPYTEDFSRIASSDNLAECERMALPVWQYTAESVIITLPLDWAMTLAEDLNEWQSLKGWVDREDCHNWTRSMTARENRRESIVYGNCLETIKHALGRQDVLLLMRKAAKSAGNEAT